MSKKIAILLATHNSEKYINQQIDSLLRQTCKDSISIVVSDDTSTDKTVDIIKEYMENHKNISLIKSEQALKSPQANFWFLLKNAPEADYYMFCDHDDVWLEEKVEKTISKMLETEDNCPAIVHSDLFVADNLLKIISPSMFSSQGLNNAPDLKNALVQNSVTGCTMMINHSLRTLALKKENVENMIMHDWYLTILCLASGKIGFVDEPLILYRQHGNNQVGAKNTKSVGYIFNKALQLKKNKNNIKSTYQQAKDIYDIFNDGTENFELIKHYAQNLNKNKIQRILSAFKFGFWKNTFLRKLGQIFFM
ncbi:MAG: glycosyltransferase family 2 protein [Clostridiales bacterium]|nr:glycosyltransferase family 2 protein [Clostridiales bacterium]